MNLLVPGLHKIAVKLIDRGDFTATDEITVNVETDSTPPGEITWKSPATQAGSGSVTLFWQNPGDSDLAKVRIYKGTSPDNLTQVGIMEAEPYAEQNFTVSNLSSGTLYYFQIKTEDYSGNVSGGSTIVSETPL